MTKIKICGLIREADIGYVNIAMPDYVGFVFTESRREIRPERAGTLRKLLNPGIIPVGVFVNAAIDDILRLWRDGVIEIAQLHGGEDEGYIERLKSRGMTIIQAIRQGRGDTPSERADYYLFDASNGGGGEAFDWDGIPGSDKPYFLAGGINPGNMRAALMKKPFALDVSSGAETNGVKDREKIQALVKAARNGENG